jgi:hypothetical protein
MYRSLLLIFSLSVLGLTSCSVAGKTDKTVPAIELTVCCNLDSGNTYEVYIPERAQSVEKLPLLIILDSHGSGKFALDKFKFGAKQNQTAIIASNTIKNGFTGFENAIQTMLDDVRGKYPVGSTVFITGFSGGARMALGYALSHQVNGLILCGALAGSDQLNAVHCPVISISGMDDFNFMETAQYLFQEQSTPGNLKIELTDASHSWPDSLLLANALGFLRLSGKAGDIPSLPESHLKTYCRNQHSRIDSLVQKGDFLKAALIARNMASAEPFSNDGDFASTYKNLKTDAGYISQLNKLKTNLDFEISVRQPFIDAFKTKDINWWENEIRTAEEKIKTVQDPFTKDTYLRIKGFWGIASFTFCQQAVKQQDIASLNKLLPIYRLLEPENPDMFYFSAFPYLWKGNNEATISTLKKAIEKGYSDMDQLKKDFPEVITSKLLLE